MAEKTGVSQVMICKDLKVIRRVWKESAVKDFDEKVAVECQKLDAIEREAWKGWRRSMRDEVTTEEGEYGEFSRSTTKRRGQAGSAQFLALAMNCVKARCELLGLNEKVDDPEKNQVPVVVQLQQIIENHGSYIELRRQQVLGGGGNVPGVPGDVCEQRDLEACQTFDVAGCGPGAGGDAEAAVAGAEVDCPADRAERSDEAD
jgi:hypothetical protein